MTFPHLFLGHWIDQRTIGWPHTLVPGTLPRSWELWASPVGGLQLDDDVVVGPGAVRLGELLPDGELTEAQLLNRGHLRGFHALRLEAERAVIEEALLGDLAVVQRDAYGTVEAFTGLQAAGVLDDLYSTAARNAELGPTFDGGTPMLRLWAPTARGVDLLLFPEDDGEPTRLPMKRQAGGVWGITGNSEWANRAYLFEVEVFVPTLGAVVRNVVTDPYSVALTVDSAHSVLVDLADQAWAPERWAVTPAPVLRHPVDHTIYELHIRDFSASDATVPPQLRGTYEAFALSNTDGVRALRELAEAGITTVHLLPSFDIATIPERRSEQARPEVPEAGPASPAQQEVVSAAADRDAFNWGYDPFHYTAPEGSYASDANQRGGLRTRAYREMVGALHGLGLQVVLDVVYNHTAESGQSPRSVLDKVVPGYYHRRCMAGMVEQSTCCENLATEHAMAEKLMVDSLVTWARHYRVDGFRFDLMGHHSRANMEAVRAALDELTAERDGIDGRRIYLYGEGWNFGEVANNTRFRQAAQGQLGGTGIGAFNDRLRDAVHGGSPLDAVRSEQGFGTGLYLDPNGVGALSPDDQLTELRRLQDLVRLGMAGNLADFELETSDGRWRRGDELDYFGVPAGYASEPAECVNYVDAHDNETLFDLGVWKLPADASMDTRVRMNTLQLATVTLGQAPSFWHAGTELLRSKSLDRDSYNAGDHFNRLDWTGKSNNFGVGLPPASRNIAHWDAMRPLLENPANRPSPADIATARAAALRLLRLRSAYPLLRLGSARLIHEKVTFPNAGADQAPGLILMRLDDTVGERVDPSVAGLLVALNASPEPIVERVDGMAGLSLQLSPVLTEGPDADPIVAATAWDAPSGTLTVPGRSAVVLVQKP
ncbi:MAG: pullulanase-type alpha-1,6-glucosidase [Propionibacteriaceae bacterium]|nr:pullulanase-type alpha-1,6-glucosidase [Propionibacteriaceae bacterium]